MTYTPFLIGQFLTGQYQYLQPWQAPQDAFEPFVNAYTYRGSIYKRSGMVVYGITGFLRYQNNENVATGNGGTGPYSGTLANFPLSGTVTIKANTAAGIRTSTATGTSGSVNWSTGGVSLATAGSINFTTGVWTITTSSNVANPQPIMIQYTYTPALNTTPVVSPIMGINSFVNETNNTETMTVEDQKRLAIYNSSTKLFDPISSISQVIWHGDGTSVTIALSTTQWTNLAPYSISITDGTSTITDDGIGNLNASGNFAAGGTVTYATSAVTLNFVAPPATTVFITMTALLQGDYFSGGNTNFFHYTNWKPLDTSTAYLYLTNNKDFVTLFDGTNLSRPAFPITLAHQIAGVNDIATTMDVEVYKNSLLFLRPTLVGSGAPEPQTIRFSQDFNPFDFVADVSGHGGLVRAPTQDWIMTSEFLRDALVVFMQNSTWLFRFTGSAFDPFRFDKINNTRTNNAPYGTIGYDEYCTSMGSKGLIACDGVSVDRYDINIIDQINDIDFDNFIQCVSRRYDDLNQSWMIYPSVERVSTNSFSDSAFIYNYLEKSFANYSINLSCIGTSQTSEDITWADFAAGSGSIVAGMSWADAQFPWNANLTQSLAPVLFGGDQNGRVYLLNENDADFNTGDPNNPTPIAANLTSKRWNPFVDQGQRVRFGYVDIYYQIDSSITLTVEFFVNNSTAPNITKVLVLDGPVNDDFAWKRIQINMQGEFLRMNIASSDRGTFVISGILLWAQPAGRLVPGQFP